MTKLRKITIKTSLVLLVIQSAVGFFLINPLSVHAADPEYISSYSLSNSAISPNSDGVKDSTAINLEFTQSVKVDLDIVDQSEIVVRHLYNSSSVKHPEEKPWDGKNNSNIIVPNATYIIRITLKDPSTDIVLETDTSKQITVVSSLTPAIQYSTILPTNQDVIASLTSSIANDPIVSTDISHTFSDNGSYDFHFTDFAGNSGTITATVSNIDKVTPAAPVITQPVTPTNLQTIPITISAEANSSIAIFGGSAPVNFQLTGGATSTVIFVSLITNTINDLSATSTDVAGNISPISNTVTITQDSIAPSSAIDPTSTATHPILTFSEDLYSEDTGDPLSSSFNSSTPGINITDFFEPTNTEIKTFSYDPTTKQLSFGLSQPSVGATIKFKAAEGKGVTDLAGNLYDPQIGRFNGIVWVQSDGMDNTAPTTELSYTTVLPTNQDVIATVIADEPVLPETTLTHTFTQNGSFTFVISDLAGNVSLITAVVANIDKTSPDASVITSLNANPDSTTINLKYSFSPDTSKVIIQVSRNSEFSDLAATIVQQPPLGIYNSDSLVPGNTYFFRIISFDNANNLTASTSNFIDLPNLTPAEMEDTETISEAISPSQSFIPLAQAAPKKPVTKENTDSASDPKKGEIKSSEDTKEPTKPSKSRDILVVIALLAIAGAAYYGYKKLPETDEISAFSPSTEPSKKPDQPKKNSVGKPKGKGKK